MPHSPLVLDLSFEGAVECLVKTLKLPPGFKEALVRFLESPEKRKLLLDYVKNARICFDTLPDCIRSALFQYSRSIQTFAEADLYRRMEANAAGVIPIVPTTLLETKKQPVFGQGTLPLEFRETTTLYITANMDLTVDEHERRLSWASFFAGFKDLLEFLGSPSAGEFAAIDECHLTKDCDQLARLAGYLRLYRWEPFFILNGNVFSEKCRTANCLKRISQGNNISLQLNLDYSYLEQIGISAFCEILKEMKNNLTFIAIFYVFDATKKSRELLQQMLADRNFNDVNPSVYTQNREKINGHQILRDFHPQRFLQPPRKLLVDISGTLRLLNRDDSVITETHFLDSRWKDQIREGYRLCRNTLSHAEI